MAIDYDAPTGQVRLLISDVDEANLLLPDEAINGFLGLNDDNVRRAAADALDAIASSEVLVSKKITTQDLATDGPAVAAELRARAAQLRARADELDSMDVFDVIPTGRCPVRPEHTGRVIEFDGPTPEAWGL